MMEAKVRVTTVGDGQFTYEPSDAGGCSSCPTPCASQMIRMPRAMPLDHWVDAAPDDELTLAMAPAQLLTLCVRVFLLPLSGFLLGAFLVDSLLPAAWLSNFNPDLVRCTAGVSGMMMILVLVRIRWRAALNALPHIVQRP